MDRMSDDTRIGLQSRLTGLYCIATSMLVRAGACGCVQMRASACRCVQMREKLARMHAPCHALFSLPVHVGRPEQVLAIPYMVSPNTCLLEV